MSSPITCHVLNTVSGTPAAGLKATLSLLAPTNPNETSGSAPQPALSFHATTNEDGRVKEWEQGSGQSLNQVMETFSQGQKIPWSIKFEIGQWYEARGVESFWPEIEVKFYVKKERGIIMYQYLLARGPILPIEDLEKFCLYTSFI